MTEYEVREVGGYDWINLVDYTEKLDSAGEGESDWVKVRVKKPFVCGYYRRNNGSEIFNPAIYFYNRHNLIGYAKSMGASVEDYVRVTVKDTAQ